MLVKCLSPEGIDACNAAVAADDSVRKALQGKSAVVQMQVRGPAGRNPEAGVINDWRPLTARLRKQHAACRETW